MSGKEREYCDECGVCEGAEFTEQDMIDFACHASGRYSEDFRAMAKLNLAKWRLERS